MHEVIYDYPGLTDVISLFAGVEAACWASMGVRIGYFDPTHTYELISSSAGIFDAWAILNKGSLARFKQSAWNPIILGEPGEYRLNSEYFISHAEKSSAEERDLLQRTFQTLLLLTSENLLTDDSLFFLEDIGWTTSGQWERVKAPRGGRRSLQRTGLGLANILDYWAEIDDVVATDRPMEEDTRSMLSFFVDQVASIVRPRFNLSNDEIVDRYFILAGEFVGREPDNSAEWLDARGKFFAQLLRVVTYARGTEVQNKERLWNEFVTGDPDRADRNGQWNLTEQADDTSISNKKKAGQKNRPTDH